MPVIWTQSENRPNDNAFGHQFTTVGFVIAVDSSYIYYNSCPSTTAGISARNLSDGSLAWGSVSIPYTNAASITNFYSDGTNLYTASWQNLHAFRQPAYNQLLVAQRNRTNGSTNWTYIISATSPWNATPQGIDGDSNNIYIATGPYVYCISKTGSLVWQTSRIQVGGSDVVLSCLKVYNGYTYALGTVQSSGIVYLVLINNTNGSFTLPWNNGTVGIDNIFVDSSGIYLSILGVVKSGEAIIEKLNFSYSVQWSYIIPPGPGAEAFTIFYSLIVFNGKVWAVGSSWDGSSQYIALCRVIDSTAGTLITNFDYTPSGSNIAEWSGVATDGTYGYIYGEDDNFSPQIAMLEKLSIITEVDIPQVYSWKILKEMDTPQTYSWMILPMEIKYKYSAPFRKNNFMGTIPIESMTSLVPSGYVA